ncbi:MAG: glycoside hydrolase family 68 protein [Alteraurantiacibacter sp.]|nr:glycoside hydrolase family 68 protein [Alteraurantiacibacter sp.]
MTSAQSTAAFSMQDWQPVRWAAPQCGKFVTGSTSIAPVIRQGDFTPPPGLLEVWDAWPVQLADGSPAPFADGSSLWMALGAPHSDDIDARHAHARIHLFRYCHGQWAHIGPVMPDGFSPGSREWSGSALYCPARREVRLFFTAAGRAGEKTITFEQRIFSACATLADDGSGRLEDWRDLQEAVVRDATYYMASDAGEGAIGTIKAFRDPAYFCDPRDGASYLLFTASAARSSSCYNGVIGVAKASDSSLSAWVALPPLVSAVGLNNELERPHMRVIDGRYYLFWSTQRHVFDPSGPIGPTGLCGMVGTGIYGDWRPLNDTGLVFSNPPAAPSQAYSWLVLPDLSVTSFVDDWGEDGTKDKRRFGGAFAPFLQLCVRGDRAWLAGHGQGDAGGRSVAGNL